MPGFAATGGLAVGGQPVPAAPAVPMTVVFLTSGSVWPLPSDWNNSNNTIEVLGAGATGTASFSLSGDGGGYAKAVNATLAGSQTFSIGQPGPAGTLNTTGDTWFGGASLVTSKVGARGGPYGQANQIANGVGTTLFHGGSGATGGPGGAAGPNGNGVDGVVGGTFGGGAGDAGFGGAGGAGGYPASPGANGGNGAEWGHLHGSGGGGGTGIPAGNGGLYGGGGAAGSTAGGVGSPGLIVISYAGNPPGAPVAILAPVVAVPSGTGASTTVAAAVGSLVVISATLWGTANGTITNVTLNNGDTVLLAAQPAPAAGIFNTSIWYAILANPLPIGGLITATTSNGSTVTLSAWSVANCTGGLDQANSVNISSAATFSLATGALASSNEFVFATERYTQGAFTEGAGFTTLYNLGSNTLSSYAIVAGSNASVTWAPTWATASVVSAAIATFIAGPPAAPITHELNLLGVGQ